MTTYERSEPMPNVLEGFTTTKVGGSNADEYATAEIGHTTEVDSIVSYQAQEPFTNDRTVIRRKL